MKGSLRKVVAILAAVTAVIMISLSGCPGGEEGQIPDEEALTFLTEQERTVFEKVNAYRGSKGLNPLEINEAMTIQARKHSQDMADGTVPFSHEGFQERIVATGIHYNSAAENLAYNMGVSDPADTAVTGWIGSEGHRRNMEGDFNLTGIGIGKSASGAIYFTQLFIKADVGVEAQPQNANKQPNEEGEQPWWLRWIR